MLTRLRSRRTPHGLGQRATGALCGQVTQALASLVLQIAAARWLGASGLATFSLIYGATVLVTAVVSGLVGDSLTVLDRTDRRIRAGLHVWAVGVAAASGVVGGTLAVLCGLLTVPAGSVLALAVTAFVLEDVLRRLLMATDRFWSLPVVDGTSLLLAAATLLVAGATGALSLLDFLVALLVGQAGGAFVAWLRTTDADRPRGPWRDPALSAVLSFGSWRAAAQAIRPGLLTALRLVVVGALGAAAYGPLEAARVYTAPTLMLVTGLGSFLLPHFVRVRDRPAASLRAADRAAAGLAAAVAAATALAVLLRPLAAPLLTGGHFAVPGLAVAGWGAYATASAVLLPYSVLAAVHRRQRRVLALRALELGSLAAVVLLVLLVPNGQAWAPLCLSAGPMVAAAAVRRSVLLPALRRPARSAAPVPDLARPVRV